MQKYGFVYIWYDSWRKMYYLGSHWGTETDGYICSSPRMRKAYRRRQNDFKRRVIQRVYSNRKELLNEETRWLQMIKKKEMYYNLHYTAHHWQSDEQKVKSLSEKISKTLTGRKQSEETKRKRSEALKARYASGFVAPYKGHKWSETRHKTSKNHLRKRDELGRYI